MVTNGDLRKTTGILTHDVGLLQANGEAKLCTGVSKVGVKPL